MRTQVGENPHYCIRRTLNKKTTQKTLHYITLKMKVQTKKKSLRQKALCCGVCIHKQLTVYLLVLRWSAFTHSCLNK